MQLPDKDKLEYVKTILETILFVMLVPLLAVAILRDPFHAGDRALGQGPLL